MNIIITLIICISASFLITLLAKKLKISVVIGLIIVGLIIGSPILKGIILEPNTEFILILGNVGLITLMFLAGLEVSWRGLYKERKNSLYLAFFAFIIPFSLGFFIFLFLGFPLLTALTIGICMSITAEATKARVLLELKKLKTKIGSLMMGAGIIDDILGIFLFLLISFLFIHTIITKEIIILLSAIISFFIGVVVHKFIGRETKKIHYLEKFLLIFIVPFFFIAMGLYFALQSITLNPWILIIVIIVAISGKILGSLFSKPLTKLKLKQLYLVGWGMNSRGAVELAIAFTAFKVGLLDNNTYSSLIIMALVTTLIFPFFIRRMIQKNPGIMRSEEHTSELQSHSLSRMPSSA